MFDFVRLPNPIERLEFDWVRLVFCSVLFDWIGHATQSSINQTGMDFVTEISFCKTPVVDEKGWFLEVESQLGKTFKVSG